MIDLFLDKRNGFLCYETTSDDVDKAEEIYELHFKDSNKVNEKTVYDKKESRLAGILGEIVFGKYLGTDGKYVGDRSLVYDYIYNEERIDVKCKFRTVVPKRNFEASFFMYQADKHFKDVDYYAFLSTITDYKYVWFCAFTDKENWLHNPKGVLWKAGQVDETNGKIFHKDTWSVFYGDLHQFSRQWEH